MGGRSATYLIAREDELRLEGQGGGQRAERGAVGHVECLGVVVRCAKLLQEWAAVRGHHAEHEQIGREGLEIIDDGSEVDLVSGHRGVIDEPHTVRRELNADVANRVYLECLVEVNERRGLDGRAPRSGGVGQLVHADLRALRRADKHAKGVGASGGSREERGVRCAVEDEWHLVGLRDGHGGRVKQRSVRAEQHIDGSPAVAGRDHVLVEARDERGVRRVVPGLEAGARRVRRTQYECASSVSGVPKGAARAVIEHAAEDIVLVVEPQVMALRRLLRLDLVQAGLRHTAADPDAVWPERAAREIEGLCGTECCARGDEEDDGAERWRHPWELRRFWGEVSSPRRVVRNRVGP